MDTGADSGAQQPQGQWTTGLFGCSEDLRNSAFSHVPPGRWTTGLCGCLEDPGSCVMTCCCPCVTFGQNAEVIDKGNSSFACAGITPYLLAYIGCGCLYSFTYRGKLRSLFNLPEDPCNDFWVHCFCSSCAICQEYRELKNRGLDPSLGWSGNEQKMNNATRVPPNIAQGMAR